MTHRKIQINSILKKEAHLFSLVTKYPNEMLNDWSKNLISPMDSINETVHLIYKEEMVHAIKA
jgi:hypothetical protein